MSSKYMLEQLHRHTMGGYQVTVAESLRNDTIRLTYQARPGGTIVGWYVEGPGMSFPLKFKTEHAFCQRNQSVDTVDKFPAHGAGGDCITLVVCRPLARRLVLT